MKFYSYLLIFSLFLVSLVSDGQDLIPFENRGTGLWGFRNQKTGNVVIEPKFDFVSDFIDGQVWVRNSEGTFLVNNKGKILESITLVIPITLDYDLVGFSSEGLCSVRKGDDETGKWGFIDKTGTEVIPLTWDYDFVQGFNEGIMLGRGWWEMGIHRQNRKRSYSPNL